jgi:hypothetical protein
MERKMFIKRHKLMNSLQRKKETGNPLAQVVLRIKPSFSGSESRFPVSMNPNPMLLFKVQKLSLI